LYFVTCFVYYVFVLYILSVTVCFVVNPDEFFTVVK
jgi:hypothetical protein